MVRSYTHDLYALLARRRIFGFLEVADRSSLMRSRYYDDVEEYA